MKVPTFLNWWTSYEVDDRKRMLSYADGDREATFDLLRDAYDAGLSAGRKTAAQLAAAPQGEGK